MEPVRQGSPDHWWQQHTRDRVNRRDLDLEWREYAQQRIESRESVRGKRRRDGEGSDDGNSATGQHNRRRTREDMSAAQIPAPEVAAAPHHLWSVPHTSVEMELTTARKALGSRLASLLNMLCDLAATGCGGCGSCAICLATLRCRRCDQCNACYEAASLHSRRQQTTLLTVCERIAAVQPAPGDGAQQLALILPVLQACGDWEAAWEAGKATATYEQQMEALWDRSQILVGCLDRWTTAAVLPTALREAAAAARAQGRLL